MSQILIDSICSSEHANLDVWRVDGICPPCRTCGAPTERLWQASGTAGVIGDECDVWIRNGLCNADSSPRHFTSKSEIAKAAKEKGLTPFVRHTAERGTDKSKHTTRWI